MNTENRERGIEKILHEHYAHFQKEVQKCFEDFYDIEKQAADRTKELQQVRINFVEAATALLNEIRQSRNEEAGSSFKIVQASDKIAQASQQISEGLNISQTRTSKSIRLLLISILVTVICIITLVGVGVHYKNKVFTAGRVYYALIDRIQKTPVIVKSQGKAYVMIEPDSEQLLTAPGGETATFAKIKYAL